MIGELMDKDLSSEKPSSEGYNNVNNIQDSIQNSIPSEREKKLDEIENMNNDEKNNEEIVILDQEILQVNEDILLICDIYEKYAKTLKSHYNNKIIMLPESYFLIDICRDIYNGIMEKLNKESDTLLLQTSKTYHQLISDIEAFDKGILLFNDLHLLLDFVRIYNNMELDSQDSILEYYSCILKYLQELQLTTIDLENFLKKDKFQQQEFLLGIINESYNLILFKHNDILNVPKYLECMLNKYQEIHENNTSSQIEEESHHKIHEEEMNNTSHKISCIFRRDISIHDNSIYFKEDEDLKENVKEFFLEITKNFQILTENENIDCYLNELKIMIFQLILHRRQYIMSENIHVNSKIHQYNNHCYCRQFLKENNSLLQSHFSFTKTIMQKLYHIVITNSKELTHLLMGIEKILLPNLFETKRQKEYKKEQIKREEKDKKNRIEYQKKSIKNENLNATKLLIKTANNEKSSKCIIY